MEEGDFLKLFEVPNDLFESAVQLGNGLVDMGHGAPVLRATLAFAPVNEMGVVFLFGAMASTLGFMVTWIGTQFPDIEAIREVEPGRWQRSRIEVEFQSRNFLQHFHDPKECDLIVCWEHNWEECPLEVVELRGAISTQQSAVSQSVAADLRR